MSACPFTHGSTGQPNVQLAHDTPDTLREVLNLYNRDNLRAALPGINGNTLRVIGLFDSDVSGYSIRGFAVSSDYNTLQKISRSSAPLRLSVEAYSWTSPKPRSPHSPPPQEFPANEPQGIRSRTCCCGSHPRLCHRQPRKAAVSSSGRRLPSSAAMCSTTRIARAFMPVSWRQPRRPAGPAIGAQLDSKEERIRSRRAAHQNRLPPGARYAAPSTSAAVRRGTHRARVLPALP